MLYSKQKNLLSWPGINTIAFMKGFKLFIVTLLLLIVNAIVSSAQTETPKDIKSAKPQSKAERVHVKKQQWKKHIQVFDTSASLIIARIEDINNTINAISDVMDNGFDTLELSRELPPLLKDLQSTKFRVTNRGANMSLRSLSIIQNKMDDWMDQLKEWKADLFTYSTQLVSITTQIGSMTNDSTLKQLPTDSALRNLYAQRVKELSSKWQSTDSIAKKTLIRVNALQSLVSENYLMAVTLDKHVDLLVKNFWQKALGQEYSFIWSADTSNKKQITLDTAVAKTIRINSRVLSNYMDNSWNLRILGISLLLLFFIWVWSSINKIENRHDAASETLMRLKYIHLFPIKAALVFAFTIAPFLDMHSPGVYTQILQITLIIILTILLALKWPRKQFVFWFILAILFIIHCIDSLMFSPAFTPRFWVLFVDLISLAFGLSLLYALKKKMIHVFDGIKPLTIGFCVLIVGALGCNVFGRVTLAAILGNTAVFSFCLAIEIMIFIKIVLEAVYLQLEAAKKSTRFAMYLNYQNIEGRLKSILVFLTGIFWFINLTQTLNLFDNAYNLTSSFLSAERTVGSTSFTMGSVVVFFLIIWVANFLQKYIGYFFDDTVNEDITAKKKIGTSILLIRLLILTIGFLLGVAASGLPIDKITIVIGALGVGIGLGLQNIVNQLVSGIILAIERPIQVGDAIDIGTRSGKVKEIGIRSSRLLTADGAEIIVPNGDLLSQTITNWTMNNNHIRVEIVVKIGNAQNIDNIKTSIISILSNADVMTTPEPQILVTNIAKEGFELKVLFWVFEISKSATMKSEILKNIYEKCQSEGVEIL